MFMWEGNEIRTMGQTMDAAIKAMREGKAEEFKAAYIASINKPEAESIVNDNLGYMGGYYDDETNAEIQKAFGVVHPVFGTTRPSPTEAYNMGLEAGKQLKRDVKP